MTTAVCFKCGEIKFGAFVPCPKCAAYPQEEDDLALALAMTDHYFDLPTLQQMGKTIRNGNPISLHPDTHAHLLETIRSSGMVKKLQQALAQSAEAPVQRRQAISGGGTDDTHVSPQDRPPAASSR